MVAIYLHMFKLQRPVEWENLGAMLESDPRLAIGGAAAEPEAPAEASVETSEKQPAPEQTSDADAEVEADSATEGISAEEE